MRATPERPYVYDCPGLDRLAQLAGATGDPDEGYPDGGADEPTITSLVRMGLTHAEIAERLGVSERHVRTLVRDAGLSADAPGRPVSRPACVDDPAWLAARTVAQAAADAGVSESTINRARARHRGAL